MVERNYVGAQTGLLETLALDLGDLGLPRVKRCLVAHAGLDHAHDLRRDVFNGHQDVQLEVRALQFLLGCPRVKAVLHVVLLGRRNFLQLPEGHVVVGEDQAVGTDERARAAVVEAHARQAHVVEPICGRRKAVGLLQLLHGRIVEGPHALFRQCERCAESE